MTAEMIFEQMGGYKFIAMTGAKNLASDNKSLSFKLPSNFADNGINHVRITLNGNDLYDLEFWKIRGLNAVKLSEESNVSVEMLRCEFTRKTGLDVTMGKIYR